MYCAWQERFVSNVQVLYIMSCHVVTSHIFLSDDDRNIFLKTQTEMKKQWIADQLHMGHWTSVTKSVKKVAKSKDRKIRLLRKEAASA